MFFCCSTDLTTGVRTMARMLPTLSISLIFYTFLLDDPVEIGLCLFYSLINLAVNFFLLAGLNKKDGLYFLPWMCWILLCITVSVTFGPVMIYVGAHIILQNEEFRRKNRADEIRFIVYGALLLTQASFYAYLWCGVFKLFKLLRRQETDTVTSRGEVQGGDVTDTLLRPQVISGPEYLDDPPSYLLAIQEKKPSIGLELPPTYSAAMLVEQK